MNWFCWRCWKQLFFWARRLTILNHEDFLMLTITVGRYGEEFVKSIIQHGSTNRAKQAVELLVLEDGLREALRQDYARVTSAVDGEAGALENHQL